MSIQNSEPSAPPVTKYLGASPSVSVASTTATSVSFSTTDAVALDTIARSSFTLLSTTEIVRVRSNVPSLALTSTW